MYGAVERGARDNASTEMRPPSRRGRGGITLVACAVTLGAAATLAVASRGATTTTTARSDAASAGTAAVAPLLARRDVPAPAPGPDVVTPLGAPAPTPTPSVGHPQECECCFRGVWHVLFLPPAQCKHCVAQGAASVKRCMRHC